MTTDFRIRVLIVDDHAIVREGLQMLLADEPGIEVIGMAADGDEALAAVTARQPDVALVDLLMPRMDGIELTRRLRSVSPETQVVILTSFAEHQQVHDAIEAGAIGYILKDVLKPELMRSIYAAARGEPALHAEAQRQLMRRAVATQEPTLLDDLTEREGDVLRLIAQGRSNKEIASELHLTEGTVKGYVSAILGKLQVADRTQAALYAVKHGV